jgi:anti-sigma factor RsiW
MSFMRSRDRSSASRVGNESMVDESPHVSEEDLLKALDGEMSRRRTAVVRTHCENCWRCRARMAVIESTIVDLVKTYQKARDARLSPIPKQRALLKARLAERVRTMKMPDNV